MPLSEEEQRVLEQLERQLRQEDPHLDQSMRATSEPSSGMVRKLVIGLCGVVLGLVLLVTAVATQVPLLGILGFVLMFAVVVYASYSPQRSAGKKQQQSKKNSKSVVDRMDERWRRRMDES